jgi:serine/threonine protein kinase
MIGQHLQAEPIPPSIRSGRVIPSELDNIILSCLAKQPSGRPASAEALVRRFEAMDQTMWSPEHARAWWEANLSSPEPAPSVAVSGSVTTRVRLPMGG